MIIGIVGKARSGKDTFAEMLASEMHRQTGKRFRLMAYAQELKLRVQKDFDLTWDQLWGDDKEVPDARYFKPVTHEHDTEPNWTAREIMQHYGEFYRSIDSQFWVRSLFNKIDEEKFENVIVTDVRHPNEADPIVERNGYVIKVTSNREGKQKIHGNQHISETAMDSYDKIDFHVKNDKDLNALLVSTQEVLTFLLKSIRMKENLEA